MRTLLLVLAVGCGGEPAYMPAPINDLSSFTTSPIVDGGVPDLSKPDPNPMPMGCGTCPSGSTCGSSNGLSVCKTANNVPLFSHVFVIVMENTSLSSLQSNTSTPYLHDLLMNGAYAADYHGVTHPSLPNYLALTSGSPGVQSDGATA